MNPRHRIWSRTLAVIVLLGPAMARGQSEHGAPVPMPAPDLAAALRSAVQESRYDAVWRVGTGVPGLAAAHEAPNRTHGFRTLFESSGIHVLPMEASEDSWRWSIALTGVGRRDDVLPPAPGTVSANGNRVEIRRGDLVEWYVNDERGLEQGFVLAAPPGGGDRSEPLRLVFAPASGVTLRHKAGDATVLVGTTGGRPVLTYSGLFVRDAAGRELPARFGLEAGSLTITVEDSGAVYPVEVDPLIAAELGGFGANDAATGDLFGASAAIEGDTAVLGAPGTSEGGAAYVFVWNGSRWSQQAKLTPAGGGAIGDAFGGSVGISGETIVVGSRFDDQLATDAGAVYVFTRAGTTWTQQQKLLAGDGVAGDAFGASVAVEEDALVVGQDGSGNPASAGAAYVFERSGGAFSPSAKLAASDGAAGDAFGCSVSLEGGTLVVGAHLDDTAAGADSGSAYVFVGSGASWSEEAHLLASAGAAGDGFGGSVALSGESAIIGAPADDTVAGIDAGAAFVYVRSGGVWSEQQILLADNAGAMDGFGGAVGISGDFTVVGAPNHANFIGADAGGAYVFVRSGAAWSPTLAIHEPFGRAGNRFGSSVALSADRCIVGAVMGDRAWTDAGAADVFALVDCPEPRLVGDDALAWEFFGASIAMDEDTVFVGAPRHGVFAGGAYWGAVYIFTKSGSGFVQEAKLQDRRKEYSTSASVWSGTATGCSSARPRIPAASSKSSCATARLGRSRRSCRPATVNGAIISAIPWRFRAIRSWWGRRKTTSTDTPRARRTSSCGAGPSGPSRRSSAAAGCSLPATISVIRSRSRATP